MSMLDDSYRSVKQRLEAATRLRTFVSALGLTFVGTIVSFVAYMAFRPAASGVIEPAFPALGALLISKGSQIGFAAFVGGYFAITRRWDDYVQIRRPTAHDLVWLFVGGAGLALTGDVVAAMLPHLGLSKAVLSGSGGLDVGLADWPVLWPVVFLGVYLFPALLEEQFYRGIVQGRLREGFHPVAEVVLGAAFYALSHALYGLGGGPDFLTAYMLYLFVLGLVFALTYERTNNLLVVALAHALSWTSIDFPFFGLV